MTEGFEREMAVFSVARRLPAGQRNAYLDETCAGDATLRQRVEELLRAGDDAGEFLEQAAPEAQRPLEALASTRAFVDPVLPGERVGDRIGRYNCCSRSGKEVAGWSIWPSRRNPFDVGSP
jgi:eukaryotic-like serine/threonine-protein kinase